MTERVIARLYLPLEMGAFARILAVVAKEFPDAVISGGSDNPDRAVSVTADDDPALTKIDRRRIARERIKR